MMPRLDLFDTVVAENGALLYWPETREERSLAAAPDERFVARLEELGVAPLSVGRVIVATWEPNEAKVLQAVRELGLELNIIFNKGAVMVLPAGVNKAERLAGGAGCAGSFSAQLRGGGRCRERHGVSGNRWRVGGRGECGADAEGAGRLGDGGGPRAWCGGSSSNGC